jgi:predicted RNA-binding Zn ribbon-like protein
MNEQHLGISFAPFDAADYLDDEETIAEYLAAASENPNPDVLRVAEQAVARVRERRREEIAAHARASIAAFQAGEIKPYSAEELIAELHQSLEDQVELPSDAGIPNAVTQRTFAETDAGENTVRCDDAQDMFTRLGSDE